MAYLDELLKEEKEKKARMDSKKGETAPPPKPAEDVKKEIIAEKKAEEVAVKEVIHKGKRTPIEKYGEVEIFKAEERPLPIYAIPVIKATGPEKIIVNTVREAATRLITVAPEEIRDPERRRNFFFRQVRDIITSSPELHIPATKVDFYSEMVVREMIGYGALDSLVKDDKLEEIMVIGPNKPVYVFHRDYEMMETNIMFGSDDEIRNIIARIARDVNRRVDISAPLLDARLPDGSRVNATIKPISLDGSTLTIRKFRKEPYTVVDLVKMGTMDVHLAAFLWTCVEGLGAKPANLLVSGGTSSGKTTTLNVLASFIPTRERVITIEDTAELLLPLDHWIRFETRPPGLERTGEITMDILVKNALRMRPDRIIVGEVRHEEAFTLFTAINTGHDGSMGSVHANSAEETLIRVMNPPMNVPASMVSALDLIITQQKIYDRRKGTIRRITEVAEVTSADKGHPKLQILYEWNAATDKIHKTSAHSIFKQTLSAFSGMTKSEIDSEISKREDLIKRLAEKKVHTMDSVIKEFKNYIGEEIKPEKRKAK